MDRGRILHGVDWSLLFLFFSPFRFLSYLFFFFLKNVLGIIKSECLSLSTILRLSGLSSVSLLLISLGGVCAAFSRRCEYGVDVSLGGDLFMMGQYLVGFFGE